MRTRLALVSVAAFALFAVLAPVCRAEGDLLALASQQYGSAELNQAFKTALDAEKGSLDAIHDADGLTPLHWACRQSHHEMVALLLVRGAGTNVADARGYTPLFYTMARSSDEAVLIRRLLVLKGANVNARARDGTTPLVQAVQADNPDAARFLLSLDANPQTAQALAEASADPRMIRTFERALAETEAQAEENATPPAGVPLPKDALQQAAKLGDVKTIRKVLAAGADINALDEKGIGAIHRAVEGARPEAVFYLLLHGANPNQPDRDGTTPLMSTMGWLGVSLDGMRHYLIVMGANPNAVRNDGHTELTWAARRGNDHGVQWLLWLGVDPNAAGAKGTPMEVASQAGYQNIIDLLHKNGVTAAYYRSDDPAWNLNNAAARGDQKAVADLLDRNTPPDAADDNGDSPVMNALGHRNVAVARYLISRGASINYQNPKSGWTPLLMTCVWDYEEMTAFRADMLKLGADPNMAAKDGTTALMRSLGTGGPGITLQQLVASKANLAARDNKGRTAVRVALDNGNTKVAKYLMSLGASE